MRREAKNINEDLGTSSAGMLNTQFMNRKSALSAGRDITELNRSDKILFHDYLKQLFELKNTYDRTAGFIKTGEDDAIKDDAEIRSLLYNLMNVSYDAYVKYFGKIK